MKEMDPDKIWELIGGHENVLAPELKKEENLFQHATCPACKSTGCEAFVNPRNPFTPGVPLANKLLRCASCRTEFDPHTRLICKAGIVLTTV